MIVSRFYEDLSVFYHKTPVLKKCIILCILQPIMFIDKICTNI